MVELEKFEDLPHYPVLYNEILHYIKPRAGGRYVDGTVGAGGHAWGLLQASSPDGKLLGLDLDPAAIEFAEQRLAPFGPRVALRRTSFSEIARQIEELGWSNVDGILLDLGVSSIQLDTRERGFSFKEDAPLDMRFDPESHVRASDLVNNLGEEELADLLTRYGEERRARKIAKGIVQARPLSTTSQLVNVILRSAGAGSRSDRHRIHPATRTFQALRIAVNQELRVLEECLPDAIAALSPGSRLAVISFHSLEDRIVKRFFRRESRDCVCPPDQPVCTCDHQASVVELSRKPIRPGAEEIRRNPRSRSALLRVVEKT